MTLNRFKLDYECLYAGNIYKINKLGEQKIELVNNGNIGSRFKWKSEESEGVSVKFWPEEGWVGAKETVGVEVELSVHRGGHFNYIL